MSETPQKINIQEAGQYLLINEDMASKLPMILKTFALLNFKLLSEMTLGEIIRFYRNINEKSLRTLAKELNIDHKHLDRIECGKIKKINNELLNKMVEIFGAKFKEAIREVGVELT